METIEQPRTELRPASSLALVVICLGYFMVIVDSTAQSTRQIHAGRRVPLITGNGRGMARFKDFSTEDLHKIVGGLSNVMQEWRAVLAHDERPMDDGCFRDTDRLWIEARTELEKRT
jgi:hypothetical protein